MYQELAELLPNGTRKKYMTLMKYADTENPERKIGFLLVLGMVFGASAAVAVTFVFSLSFLIFLLLIAVFYLFFEIIFYTLLVLRADGRGKAVENILPDALLLMSMNIRSGMTTDRALIMSALTEFGPLEKELNRAGKQLLAGKEVREAFLDITTRIKSGLFERTIRLIVEGVESGGELSSLLLQTAEDIQNTRLVQNEIRANVLMYVIFIFFAAGIGAPLLFGISTYLVGALTKQFSTFQATGASQFVGGSVANITPDFLTFFALMSLTLTSFFGGLMMGVVKGGSEKDGLKLIPILFALSMTVFFVVRGIVSNILPS